MDERTTFGLKISAEPSNKITEQSKAAAVRKIVPTLPGSCTPSSTAIIFFCKISSRVENFCRATSKMPCGVFVSEIFSSVDGEISSKFFSRSTKIFARASDKNSRVKNPNSTSAGGTSSHNLKPSATKSFSSLRNFFCANFRTSFTFDI